MTSLKASVGAACMTFVMAGCAHTSFPKEASPTLTPVPPPAIAAVETPVPAPGVQVALPYTFVRRGVEIRITSVEFVKDQLQVNVSLQETRNDNAELLASTLMEARTPSGETLPYQGYSRDGQTQSAPEIKLSSQQRSFIVLSFQRPASSTPGSPMELRFPTGKWWSSTRTP